MHSQVPSWTVDRCCFLLCCYTVRVVCMCCVCECVGMSVVCDADLHLCRLPFRMRKWMPLLAASDWLPCHRPYEAPATSSIAPCARTPPVSQVHISPELYVAVVQGICYINVLVFIIICKTLLFTQNSHTTHIHHSQQTHTHTTVVLFCVPPQPLPSSCHQN